MIHVASHGVLSEDDARLSGLRLSGGDWTVYDLFDAPTRADLIVLSACQSGEEVLWGGDEGVGLVPGLFQTGARSTIVSLWSVDDAVANATMTELHRHLAGGVGPGEALERCWAQQRRVSGSPFHWAPFVLYGADTPRGKPS